jgi:hypothetical protein
MLSLDYEIRSSFLHMKNTWFALGLTGVLLSVPSADEKGHMI